MKALAAESQTPKCWRLILATRCLMHVLTIYCMLAQCYTNSSIACIASQRLILLMLGLHISAAGTRQSAWSYFNTAMSKNSR